jgi:glycosyltransferase involved in cell wall biosynthesis
VGRAIAVLLKGYPRLSETFIAQEILGLEQRGLDLRIVSLRHPTDSRRHPVHEEINAPVLYLPEYLYQAPLRVFRGLLAALGTGNFYSVLRTWLHDLRRDPTSNRVRRFGQALVLARELAPEAAHIHAHFLHTPASVARYAAALRGLTWTCSAHAKDVWTTPQWEKREKLADCAWLVTCTAFNRTHLAALAPEAGRVELVYHGLDLARFPQIEADTARRDGSSPDNTARLLCVGRAVEKKGLDDLLSALARLPDSLHWEFHHVGGGPLLDDLKRQSEALGLSARVHWHGPLAQREVLCRYADADLFVLASRVARDGDRDGLPNVLMEAQSQGLACVSTDVSAIPELIHNAETGLLVAPGDIGGLAGAVGRLISDPQLRMGLAKAGERRVRAEFGFVAGLDRLAEKLNGVLDKGE